MPGDIATVAMLGLFPSLVSVGGVQASGRLVVDRYFLPGNVNRADVTNPRTFLFTYGCEGPINEQRDCPSTAHATTRTAAIRLALTRRWDVDLLFVWHVHLIRLLPFLRRPRCRVVLMMHGIEVWRRFDPVTLCLLRSVDLFVTNSDFTWSRFVEANPEFATKPHSTVHLGLGEPMSQLPPASTNPPVVLMVGRLAPAANEDKGHRAMIRAWPGVRQEIPSAELWIVGDGQLRPELEQLAARNRVSGSVRFLGQVTEATKQDALARCRCLALPSRGEGFGLVYLEAMRSGRPCLVSTLDAGREVVRPPIAGLAANPDDLDELATATARLLSDGDEWDSWSHEARARYEQNFTGRHFLDRLGTVLEK